MPADLLKALGLATTNSGTYTLPNSRTTAGEYPWVIRILSYHPGAVVPRRMYTASCTTGGVRKLFASITTRSTTGTEEGMIISGDVASTGVVSNFTSRSFPTCKDMNGIVAASDWFPCVSGSPATRFELKYPFTPPNNQFVLMLSIGIRYGYPAKANGVDQAKHAGAARVLKVV